MRFPSAAPRLALVLALLAPIAANGQSGSVEAGPFTLEYRIEGSGPTALVIGPQRYYRRVFSEGLRNHLELIFVDHRGVGPAPETIDDASFELDTIVDDIERVRKRVGREPVVVIGHSGQSFMALEYAKKYPEAVSHVVMIAISPDLGPENRAAAARYWDESVSPERKARLAANRAQVGDEALAELPFSERFVRRYLREAPRIWFDPTFDAAALWEGIRINAVTEHIWGQVFTQIEIGKGLERFDRPVLLALGRYDYLVAPPSSWDVLRPKFRDLTVRVFERSGHTPPLEEPERFDAALLEWIEGRD